MAASEPGDGTGLAARQDHRGQEVVLVAMVAGNGVIGDGTDQPWHLREDLRRFKKLTTGHPLVMGRATYDAIGRLLPGRETVVVTRNQDWSIEGAHVVHGIQEALTTAAALPGGESVMVIGGGQIYEAAMPHATRLELTEVDAPATGNVRFPDLDPRAWAETTRDDRAALAFVTYRRIGSTSETGVTPSDQHRHTPGPA